MTALRPAPAAACAGAARADYGAPPAAAYLARVVDVQDPQALGRVQVRLANFDGVDGHDAPLWARVAVPFAGADRGAFMLPDVDDEVLVAFAGGDARQPVVVGGLWNGAAAPPESLGGSRVDRWTIVGRHGTRIAIVEESEATATISLTTPGRAELVTITREAGGAIELSAAGNTVTLDTAGVTVRAAALVKVDASQVEVNAGLVTVNAGMSRFAGVVQCDTLITNAVVSSSYTPGAGNVW